MVYFLHRAFLFFLLFLSLVNTIYFYFQGDMPDNYYVISSIDNYVPFISYYFFSFIYFFGFYSGTWVIVPTLIFAATFTFIYSKRDEIKDLITSYLFILFSLSIFNLIIPNSFGQGLHKLLSLYFSWEALLGISLLSLLIIALMNFKLGEINLKEKFNKLNYVLTKIRWKKPNLKWTVTSASEEKYNEIDEDELLEKVPNQIASIQSSSEVSIVEGNGKTIDSSFEHIPKKHQHINQTELIACITPDKTSKKISSPKDDYFHEITDKIEDKLKEFKVDGRIINIMKGPVVDTFELELGQGVKVSKVTSLTEDLSLALAGAPLRMVYPMKGKTTLGIEVPRNPRDIIYLDDVLETRAFKKTQASLPMVMGKDVFGHTKVVDLSSMPHMLVAGSTGAGKSVFINSILVSLLVKRSPEEMKLILIDPKQIELALYQNLPHLMLPVVTSPKEANLSLLWACQEMERRYSILKELGVRSLDSYNHKIQAHKPEHVAKIQIHFNNTVKDFTLPYIVIIVDEFADLIKSRVGKDIETNISRLAAKARAAGIHLIIATQRPSVDVITGTIKSNFPTRVSFRVTAKEDSRTILGGMGAEKLLGKGDMLYRHGVETVRLHSAFVEEDEIEALTNRLASMDKQFDEEALHFLETGGDEDAGFIDIPGVSNLGPNSSDELFDDAVKVVMEVRMASASMLQRRLRIGYNRAANLVEQMEARGIIGPQQGSKPRKVLVGEDSASP